MLLLLENNNKWHKLKMSIKNRLKRKKWRKLLKRRRRKKRPKPRPSRLPKTVPKLRCSPPPTMPPLKSTWLRWKLTFRPTCRLRLMLVHQRLRSLLVPDPKIFQRLQTASLWEQLFQVVRRLPLPVQL